MDMLMCMVTPSVDILSYSLKKACNIIGWWIFQNEYFLSNMKKKVMWNLPWWLFLNVFSLIPEMWYIDNQVKENKS